MRRHHDLNRTLVRFTAFTLIELLVVISIIALLIALLLPALSRSRQSSRNLQCLNNQRQMMIAVNTYSNDNDEHLPFTGRDYPHFPVMDFFELGLRSYMASPLIGKETVVHCPNDEHEPGYWGAWWNGMYGPMTQSQHHTSVQSLVGTAIPEVVHYSYQWTYKMYHDVNPETGYIVAALRRYKVSEVRFPSNLVAMHCRGEVPSDPHQYENDPNFNGIFCGFIDGHAAYVEFAIMNPTQIGVYPNGSKNTDWTLWGVFGRDF